MIGPEVDPMLEYGYWEANRERELALVQTWDGPTLNWREWAQPTADRLGATGWKKLPLDVRGHRQATKILKLLRIALKELSLPRGVVALSLVGLPDSGAIDLAESMAPMGGVIVQTTAYVAVTVGRATS